MRPETVGASESRLVLGKHSGRHALAARLSALGCPLQGAALDLAFDRFKALCDGKKQPDDADLAAIAAELRVAGQAPGQLGGHPQTPAYGVHRLAGAEAKEAQP
jgi:2-isopropylmalate synthase